MTTMTASTVCGSTHAWETLPIHDTDAEAGALACVVSASRPEAERMLGQLAPDDFYDARHREIFPALRCLNIDGKPLDCVSLSQWLKDKGRLQDAGGLEYVSALPDKTPSPANFPTYLETVRDRAERRAAERDAAELVSLARNPAIPASVISDAARRMAEAHSRKGNESNRLTIRKPDELLAMQFDESDRILGDRLLAKGQSLVIAGAGSIGKSRLALQLAVATITGRQWLGFETRCPGITWLILQAENSNRRLQADLASLRTWAGPADWQRVNSQLAVHTLESDADAFLTIDNPRTQDSIAQLIRELDPGIIVFDSLYNFGAGDLNRDEDMAATLLTLARLAKAGNPDRAIIPLHHALTGKAGASRATGYDRASFGRNSKVLHAWTRGQINVAPGSPDSNDTLVLSCGKCSNGKEFAPFAVRLNTQTMIYETAPDFDLAGWQSEIAGKKSDGPQMSPPRVRELCLPEGMGKAELAKAIMDDCGCYRGSAYRYITRAEKAKTITPRKADGLYFRK